MFDPHTAIVVLIFLGAFIVIAKYREDIVMLLGGLAASGIYYFLFLHHTLLAIIKTAIMNQTDFSEALPSKRIVALEASLDAKIERYFDPLDTDPDVLKQLLADKRSENTRRAYERDVNDFLVTMTGKSAVPDNVLEFLHLEERQAVAVVLKYKAKLIEKGLKEATVNRRLAAVKSLVEMGRKLGACHYTLGDIKGEKVTSYRDTTGVDRPTFERVRSGAIGQLWRGSVTMLCSGCCGVMLCGETKSAS